MHDSCSRDPAVAPLCRAAPLLALLGLAALLAACTPAISPRSGRVLEPGAFAAEFRGTLAAGAPATLELTKRTGDTVATDTNSAARTSLPPLAWLGAWFWIEYSFRFGLFDPCELGLEYGVLQLGGELRCGLLDDRDGDVVSLALGAGALYHPAHLEDGWLGRVGLDLGLPLGAGWSLIGGLWTQYGTHGHAMTLDEDDVDEKFLEQSDDFLFAEPSPYAYLERRELRLTGHLGASLDFEDGSGNFTLALVPWVTPWASEVDASACYGCEFLDPSALDERWGLALSTSLAVRTAPDLYGPDADATRPPPPGYHHERRLDQDLFVGGLVTLGTAYGIALGPLVMLSLEQSDDDLDALALWFIPVLGPVLWRQQIDAEEPLERAMIDLVGYGTSVLQVAGGLLLVQSYLFGDLVLVEDDDGTRVQVAPVPVAAGGGLGLSGRF